jgi:hypothetical protein
MGILWDFLQLKWRLNGDANVGFEWFFLWDFSWGFNGDKKNWIEWGYFPCVPQGHHSCHIIFVMENTYGAMFFTKNHRETHTHNYVIYIISYHIISYYIIKLI